MLDCIHGMRLWYSIYKILFLFPTICPGYYNMVSCITIVLYLMVVDYDAMQFALRA